MNCHGTDENVSAILKYPEEKIAVFSTHTKVKMDCSAYIYGTNGTIKVLLYILSYSLLIRVIFLYINNKLPYYKLLSLYAYVASCTHNINIYNIF